MTPQTVGDEHWALVWFALPCYSLLRTHMYWFTLHCIAEFNLWWLHREKLAKELLTRFPHSLGLVGEPCGSFWIELICECWLLNGLDCHCWFMLVFCYRTGLLISEQQRLESPQWTISKYAHFPHLLKTFLSYYFWWWARWEVEHLSKLVVKNICLHPYSP